MTTGADFAAVVLAAGAGSRFGGGKLTAAYRGAPLIHGALAAARASGGAITVVTGADAEAVARAARAFDPAVRIVHAADHAEGMGASLKAGLAGLPAGLAGAFVFLGDMPRVPHAVLAPLAAAVRAGAPAAAAAFRGARGHPVVLSAALLDGAEALAGDVGARPLIQGLGARLALVEAPDDGVLFDVDERPDLAG
ncbi:MAG: NTP transferase domain-containing protein [Phenylobacterium sp.]|uniref:nucleotidyltransferase family protein n=1 Tax=Phenylobacterium sp. TaxID=1871053 RepID=UPI001A60E060|nr:NTP transferase domain-containing protein [Phenylobacterium sp.]MBL8553482.1 NTP transferase domain-containing protein [Phenylobacterium sp.]